MSNARNNSGPAVFTNKKRIGLLDRRFFEKVFCLRLNGRPTGLLKGVSKLEHTRFGERRAEDLQSYGKLPANFAAGDRDSWDPRQRSSNCLYISEIHLQRVF